MISRIRRRAAPVLMVLGIALGIPLGALASHQFADVPNSNPFHNDIDALVSAGITFGCGGGNYCPSNFVTREQAAAFMNRLGSLDGTTAPSVNADKLDGIDSAGFERPMWAVVNSDGSLARGASVLSSSRIDTGFYEVIFNRDVTPCAYTATHGDPGLGPPPRGFISTGGRVGQPAGVFVETRTTADALEDHSFHLHVSCVGAAG